KHGFTYKSINCYNGKIDNNDYYKKVLSSPMLYLSAYFEAHREEYYSRLNAISGENKWEDWILYFLTAVTEQSRNNSNKAKAIHDLYEIKKDKIARLTHSQYAIKTLDFIFKVPIFRGNDFVIVTKISSATAKRILKQLAEGKVVSILEKGKGKASNVYVFNKLLNIVG
ncbi:hypothetical protein KJ854_04980, partial [Patescibacteria group bacterium]|nr:hypothetical protein [Patescibacteria group bacterium]